MLQNRCCEVYGIDLNKLWEESYPNRKCLERLHVQAIDLEKKA